MPTVTPTDFSAPQVIAQEQAPAPAAPQETSTIDPKQAEEAKRFDQLARREKIIRHQTRQLQEKERALLQKEEEFKSKAIDESWKERALNNPLEHLQDLGVTADKLTDLLLNRDLTKEQVGSLEKKLNQVLEEQNKIKETMTKSQTESYEQAKHQMLMDTRRMVANDPKFEILKDKGAENEVVKLVELGFQRGIPGVCNKGEIIDIDKAAELIQNELIEDALSYMKYQQIKEKINPRPNEMPVAKPNQVIVKPRVTTLTHTMQSQSKPLTDKDRIARAKLAFEGKLQG